MTGYKSKRAAAQDKGEKRMKIEEIVDYAMPAMLAEKALKETHQFMLEQQPMKAMEVGIMAIKYVHDMLDAIEENMLDAIEEKQK